MAQNFACPGCGAPLDYSGNGASTISCPYCYTSVIVPTELRGQQAQPVSPEVSQVLSGQAPKLRELSNLVRAKQRDQAVAVYQQVYGASPSDAQRLVDQLMNGSSTVLSSDMPGAVSVINVSTPMGTYTVNQYGGYPSMGAGMGMPNTVNYSVTPPAAYYANVANMTNQATKRWIWYMGCFFVFFIFIAIVTTVPFLILPFFFSSFFKF